MARVADGGRRVGASRQFGAVVFGIRAERTKIAGKNAGDTRQSTLRRSGRWRLIWIKSRSNDRSTFISMESALTVEHTRARGEAAPASGHDPLSTLVLEQLASAHDLLACGPAAIHLGVHQARKSLRRVRAALALGAPQLGPKAQRLDEELGRLCRGLSPLRDAQALVEALARLSDEAACGKTDLPAAIALAEQRRDTVLAAAIARDPAFAARRARLQRARRAIAGLNWADVDADTARAMLEKAGHRVAKAEKRAKKHPEHDEDWHRLRRRVRRLRQMQSLAQAAFGLEAHAHDRGDHLATALGHSQDDTLIVRHCHSRSPFPSSLRRQLRAIAAARVRRARQ